MKKNLVNSRFEDAYRAKLKEAINKAKIYYADDPQLKPLIERYSKFSWENLSAVGKFGIGFLVLYLVVGIVMLILWLAGVLN